MNSLVSSEEFSNVYETIEEGVGETSLFTVSIVMDKIKKKRLTAYKLKSLEWF